MRFKRLFCFLLVVCFIASQPVLGEAKNKKKKVVTKKTVQTEKKEEKLSALTIMGEPLASKEQAVNFIKKSNPHFRLTCSLENLVDLYYKEAALEGIRGDVALSQALLETGFFRYGGDVKYNQNNFCGLGSVGGGAKGASFKTAEIGVRAHIQHLLAYASKRAPKTKIVDPRYDMVTRRSDIFGACKTWHDLDGRWAAKGVPYGERILNIHERMMNTEPKNAKTIVETVKKEEVRTEGSNSKKKNSSKMKRITEEILKEGKKK